MASPPDYKIMAQHNTTRREKGEIGAGWINSDGSITLKFNPYVTVPTGDDYGIRMFLQKKEPVLQPNDTGTAQRRLDLDDKKPASTVHNADDGIPF